MTECDHQGAWHYKSGVDSVTGERWAICNRCGLDGAGQAVPDVYLARSGQTFQNLCDEMGRPYEIRSKRHKKEVMNKLGVSEAGDSVRGAPYGSKSWIEGTRDYRRKGFEKERPMLREVYREWRDRARSK